MSKNYDNWERLMAAVLKREQFRQLCREDSITSSSRSSISSDFNFSSISSSLNFVNPRDEFFKSAQSLPFQTLVRIRTRGQTSETNAEPDQLVLYKDSPFAFELEELLTAPSILLGEELETFNNTYMVSLREDILFVVKKLSRGDFTRKEFEQQVKIFRRIEHENVVMLRGYYSSGDRCLGIYDYFPQGSLYTMLHGKQGECRVHLDWETRVRIAIGAAKGLAYLHRQWSGRKFVHGNIKASNIFLNLQQYGCLADASLATVPFCPYSSPEVSRNTMESDVYSFGVVLIELVSGKSPLPFFRRHKTFTDWALHNARDEWTALVFDKELLKNPEVKQGIWYMLALAMSCVREKPETRPRMEDVVVELEFISTEFCV